MAEKPATTPSKPKRKGGRPTRAEATAKALAAIGVDPALINPKNILAAIAADLSAPPSARVMACRALLTARDPAGMKQQSNGKRGKKALAQRAASRVGGRGPDWGNDLVWTPGGGRRQ